jgi:DNA-binding response OmpR family regulator
MGVNGIQKVLIVDDEQDICFLFGRILKGRNLKSGYALSLAEARSSVMEEPPSLVFLDNSLPDGPGIDFIPFLKRNFPATRVIVVTANDTATDKKKALQSGADEFLGKPLSMESIKRELDKLAT